jgi:hypothetical protein
VTDADDEMAPDEMSAAEMSPADEALMRALAEALGTRQPPIDLVPRCEGLLSWIDIDAELAMLLDEPVMEAAGTRGAASPTSTLVFTVDDGTCVIELVPERDVLRGQLLGGDAQQVIVRTASGSVHPAVVDESGNFALEDPPTGTIRLELELFPESRRIHTDWFVV